MHAIWRATLSKNRKAFRCVTLLAILFVVLVTINSGVQRKLSSVIQGYVFYQAKEDSDQLLDAVKSTEGKSTLYLFVNGTITVNEEFMHDISQQSEQQIDSMTQPNLEIMHERLLLEATAKCSVSRSFGRTAPAQSLCTVARFEPHQPCYSFSFCNNCISWELEKELASSIGCQVLAFDPSMKQASHMRSERLLLLKEGLSDTAASGTVGSPPMDTYLGYLNRYNADKVIVDVLKMDVKPRDWPALETAVHDGSLRNVKQLLLRIHRNRDNIDSSKQLQSRVSSLISLSQIGFRRWHPASVTANQLEDSILSYININFLSQYSRSVRNSADSRISLPLKSLSISRGQQYEQLDTVRRANLSAMSAAQLDVLYFNLVEQQHVICPRSLRIGDADDGGWDVCFSEAFDIAKSTPCIAYSFGINNIWRYDDELADVHHCRVYMFDPSMTKVNDHQRRGSSWFYRIGLSSNNTVALNGWKMRTLCRLLDKFGHSNKTIDILKIDIDYWEWVTFETALKEGCLKRVKQFMFETHTTGLFHKQSDYARFIRILLDIFDLGFRTWKWHKNPYSVFYKSDSGLTRACCYEHYMLNTNFIHQSELLP